MTRILTRGLPAAFLIVLMLFSFPVPSGGWSGADGRRVKYGTVNGGKILPADQARAKAEKMVRQQMRGLRDGGRVNVRLKIFSRYTFWGEAVTYSEATNGSSTACGVPFRDDRLTAAHRTLPCGTKVLVENARNGRRVTVEITDRGPFGDDGRVLDLSPAAWRRLTDTPPGVMHVHAIVMKRG